MGRTIRGRATGRIYEPADHELTEAELQSTHRDVIALMLDSIETDERLARSILADLRCTRPFFSS